MIDHIDHIVLTTRDLQGCIRFYTEILGMKLEKFAEGRLALKFGNQKINLHEWGKDHAHNHLGGTMRPCQAVPEMSPFYIEFEEYFGGYNFGTGNAQLDFKDMKFDWACG